MDETPINDRRERKDAQRNLERVLHAAHTLFSERGTDVTMEEVARRAGVGVGTVYRRFPSKEHLVAAVSHAACADTQHRLQEAAQAEHDPIGKLRALVLVQYHRCAGQAVLLDLRSPENTVSGSVFDQQIYDSFHTLLQQVIADGQRQGIIRTGDPAILAALCLEVLSPHAFTNLARISGSKPEDLAEYAVRFVLAGLGVH